MIHPRYQGALYAYFVHIEKWFKANEDKIRRRASKWLTIIPNQVRYYINSTLTFLSQKAGQQKVHKVGSSPSTLGMDINANSGAPSSNVGALGDYGDMQRARGDTAASAGNGDSLYVAMDTNAAPVTAD